MGQALTPVADALNPGLQFGRLRPGSRNFFPAGSAPGRENGAAGSEMEAGNTFALMKSSLLAAEKAKLSTEVTGADADVKDQLRRAWLKKLLK